MVLEQDGKEVRSTENSRSKFLGRVEDGYLNGWIELEERESKELEERRSLRLRMSSDYKSFSGNFWHTMSAVTGQIWGKRKE